MFELAGYGHTWGEHRVFFRNPGEQRVQSMPAGWTDVEGVDAVVAVAAGRAHFRVDDLLVLVRLLRTLENGEA